MKPRGIAAALLAGSLADAGGCATIFRGTTQQITVDSDPRGATIRHLGTGETWTAPVELRLPRGDRHDFLATLDAHEPAQFQLRSEANVGWWIADAFTLGIGNLVDALTGALFDLSPERVHVVLEERATRPGP
jgi:hypothetical protein